MLACGLSKNTLDHHHNLQMSMQGLLPTPLGFLRPNFETCIQTQSARPEFDRKEVLVWPEMVSNALKDCFNKADCAMGASSQHGEHGALHPKRHQHHPGPLPSITLHLYSQAPRKKVSEPTGPPPSDYWAAVCTRMSP